MQLDWLTALEQAYQKSAEHHLHPAYEALLERLRFEPLTQELVDFLCEKAVSKMYIWEVRKRALRVLLLNESSRRFDLQDVYLQSPPQP